MSTLTCIVITAILTGTAWSQNVTKKNSELFGYMKYRMNTRSRKELASSEQLFSLTKFLVNQEMKKCQLLVINHHSFSFASKRVQIDESKLLREFDFPLVTTRIGRNNHVDERLRNMPGKQCKGTLLFAKDVALTNTLAGNQTLDKVIVITESSRWRILDYLESPLAKSIVNLLIVATTGPSDIIIRRGEQRRSEKFFTMYTHELYVDGLGGSRVRTVTSWRGNRLSRNVTLFPKKLAGGFSGRQLAVVAVNQPPFVIKRAIDFKEDADESSRWDGIEIRLLHMLSAFMNFTMEIKEGPPRTNISGPAEAVARAVVEGWAEVATAGIYRAASLPKGLAFSAPHSVDCATFVTRSSHALPRYRAIIGPFHWHVWLVLLLTYFLAIFPLTFADQHSFQVLRDNPWHVETMFWYVFGTFTNCFTFKGKKSWTSSEKHAPRILIGSYWAFSIIITACYTGSIIAFITLFVFPAGIDTVDQLLEDNYRVGTLSTGGWSDWFNNSLHPETKWLLRDIETVPNIYEGFRNVSESFFLPFLRPYTFLGSRAEMDYTLKTNYTLKNKKAVMYVSRDCFVPFGVSLIYPQDSPYKHLLDEYILRAQQSGLIAKVFNDMQWELLRSSTGSRIQVGASSLRTAITQDRRLTLDDTQGMFLLLGAGFLMAAISLFFEISRYHQSSGKSFKLWQWRPKIPFLHQLANLRKLILEYHQMYKEELSPETNETLDNGFLYKSYDSRVLNSRYHDVKPLKFQSDSVILEKEPRSKQMLSLPTLRGERSEMRKTSSCHDIRTIQRAVHGVDVGTSHSPRTIRFGSVGSILEIKHCHGLWSYEFCYDRPQTCLV